MAAAKKVALKTQCPYCTKFTTVTINESQLNAYLGGAMIHEAFPKLSADDREMLMTGICPPCYEGIFNDPEEDMLRFMRGETI